LLAMLRQLLLLLLLLRLLLVFVVLLLLLLLLLLLRKEGEKSWREERYFGLLCGEGKRGREGERAGS